MSDQRQRLLVILGLIVLGLACLPIDLAMSRWFLQGGLPGEIRSIFHRGEVFGHGYGVLAVVITIYLVNPQRRRQVGVAAASFAVAGLTANVLKIQFWRVRPYAGVSIPEVRDTFVGSFWTGSSRDLVEFSNNALRSFPSGHTAGAVAFAYALGRMYPQGRGWFMLLAALCAGNRVDGGAHFLSDVFWGAAVGMLASTWVTDRMWSRVELRPDSSQPPTLQDVETCTNDRRAA
ncbi:MAG: phosphatase PAP2 family protein [Planctomycetales bacterium]|nr:phosphatase PAP2 family protein [Planctomycetales bacterium]